MADPGDAVQLGLVASLARPGANITSLAPELATKRAGIAQRGVSQDRARRGSLEFRHPARGPPGFAEAFAAIMRERGDALFVFPDPLTFGL
jgi:hypothetical protein